MFQSTDGFGGLDRNLQHILNDLCTSFVYEEYVDPYHDYEYGIRYQQEFQV